MGVFNCPITLENMDGGRSLDIEAMVDTGASYTIVPARLLRELPTGPWIDIGEALRQSPP